MEPILTNKNDRFNIIPINQKYNDLWNLYLTHSNAFWRHGEIDYSADLDDWETLNDHEKKYIGMILAFFAGSDGIVLENLVFNFCSEVKIAEARAFYSFQAMIENEHSITYGLLIDTFIKDSQTKQKYFNAIDHIPVVAKKAQWAIKWIGSKQSFAVRLIAFAIVEGIFFSGAFCSIFWLKDKNKMVKALGHSNELISRDEGLHVQFAVCLFHHLIHKPLFSEIRQMFEDAVQLEIEFITEAIPCKLIGMNAELMIKYIKYVADRLLIQLNYSRLYNITECPFDFMVKIGLDGKTNFFEKRVSEYQLNSEKIVNDAFEINKDDEF